MRISFEGMGQRIVTFPTGTCKKGIVSKPNGNANNVIIEI